MSRVLKDSGIQWIGKIPENRTRARIKDLQDNNHPYPIGDGDHGQIKPDDYQDEGIPYIRVQNLGRGSKLLLDDVVYISEEVNNNNKKSILHPGDILVAKTGATFGKTGIIPDDMEQANTTSSVGKVTISKDFSNKYVFYCLGSDVCYKQMELIASQKSAQPGFNIEDLVDFYIPLPSPEEQQKIADYLDKKCSKIDLQKENYAKSIELLREYRESLIDKTVNKSEFKKIKIKYTVTVRNEKSIVDENDNYISLENIESKTGKYLKTEGDYIGSDCKVFCKGDLLINKLRPYLTKSLLCSDDGKCTGEVEVIKKFSGDIRYLKYYSLSKTFIDDVNSSTYGTKMPRANRGYIENIKMPLPPLSEQKEIADYLDKEISKIDKIISYREKMIEKIDEYKKSLIYECVTGKREIS